MADIFISYASQDRERIRPLVVELEREGWSVWWDRNIATGETFDRVIEHELDAASCVVVVWSNDSVESSWVRNEAAEGQARNVLVPVAIDRVRPPLAFRSMQTADLLGWSGEQGHVVLPQLLADIRSRLVGSGQPHQSVNARQTRPEVRHEHVIAIVPLRDLTPEQNLGYLCEGLAEELMNAVFQIDGVRVLSSRETFAYREATPNAREIGQALGASLILEGSIRRTPDGGMAALVRLVEVGSGRAVYSERFSERLEDLTAVDTTIAPKVLDGIQHHLGRSVANVHMASNIPNPLAYRVIQQANKSDLSDVEGSLWGLKLIAALECALAIDPGIERIYAQLGNAYMRLQGVFGTDVVKQKLKALLEQLNRQRPNSRAGLAIEIELADDMHALAARCKSDMLSGDGLFAYAHPTGLPDIRVGLATAIAHSGLYQEALEFFEQVDRVGEANRYNNWCHQLGCLVALGQFEGALSQAQRMRDVAPTGAPGVLVPEWELIAHIATGAYDDAEQLLRRAERLMMFERSHAQDVLRHKSGEAVDVTWQDINEAKRGLEGKAYRLLSLGIVDQGLDALEAAVATSSSQGNAHWISFRLPIYCHLFDAKIIQHPRYRNIVATLNLDEASRRDVQNEIRELTSVTGVAPAPLITI